MSFKAFEPSESPTDSIKNSAQKEQKALSLGTHAAAVASRKAIVDGADV